MQTLEMSKLKLNDDIVVEYYLATEMCLNHLYTSCSKGNRATKHTVICHRMLSVCLKFGIDPRILGTYKLNKITKVIRKFERENCSIKNAIDAIYEK